MYYYLSPFGQQIFKSKIGIKRSLNLKEATLIYKPEYRLHKLRHFLFSFMP